MMDRQIAPRRTRRRARRLPRAFFCALLLATGIAVAGTTSPVARAASDSGSFVAGVEDLPLMPGLTELSGSGYAFGSSSGRIVEAYATGDVSQQQVLDFYSATLPQLGWEAATSHSYRRQGERLAIDFVKGSGPLTVHFTVTPE
jgi:hypothetical protein